MSEALLDLLRPHLEAAEDPSKPNIDDNTTSHYLNRLSTLELSTLANSESQALAQSAHSNLLSIQALSTRSSKPIVRSTDELQALQSTLPDLATSAATTRDGVSHLDKSVLKFSKKYSLSGQNEVMDRRKRTLLMARNVDRLSDILELPSLLNATVASAAQPGASSSTHGSYASALDLHAHIKRLHQTYPDSKLLKSIYNSAEASMTEMKAHLIASLRGQTVKLTAGMRTIGWLRRLVPSLAHTSRESVGSLGEGSFGALFLACRLANLLTMLEALEPLRELANQETEKRLAGNLGNPDAGGSAWAGGQQTERYLKRFIEIFREQSFAIVSLFRSVFPADEEGAKLEDLGLQFKTSGLQSTLPGQHAAQQDDPLQRLPSALATFPAHLVDLLFDSLRAYLPNVRDKAAKESLLTQVLYCAGSLGRLGADFGMMLALLEEDGADQGLSLDWAAVMKKHRELSGRLESMTSRPAAKGRSASSNVKVNA